MRMKTVFVGVLAELALFVVCWMVGFAVTVLAGTNESVGITAIIGFATLLAAALILLLADLFGSLVEDVW